MLDVREREREKEYNVAYHYFPLQEVQSMHKDLLDGYASNLAKLVEVSQNKVKGIITYFHRLNLAINSCILLTLIGKIRIRER